MPIFRTVAICLLLAATASAADVLPSAGKAVGVVIDDTPGSWAVAAQDFMPVDEKSVKQFNGSEKDGFLGCMFEGPAGRYLVIKSGSGKLKLFAVTLGGVAPNPVPVPIPTPGPDPTPGPLPVPLPAGRYGFAQASFDSAANIPAPVRKHSAALAENYAVSAAAIKSQIAAGSVPKVADVLDNLRRNNRLTLGANVDTGVGGDIEAWRPWFVAWQTKADGLSSTLKTATDYADAFSETSIGLKAVK